MVEQQQRRPWALILGCSSGFGAAASLSLARSGYNVAGVHLDRRSRREQIAVLEEQLREHGAHVHFTNANASSAAKREACLNSLADVTGPGGVQVVLHSLAFGSLRPLLGDVEVATTPAQLQMTMDVMAHSLVWWVQDLVRREMLQSGARVFAMTSAGGERVYPSYGAVASAKAALESHVRQLAFELRGRGIAVNAICAGVTDTAALRQIPGHEKLIGAALDRSGFTPPRLCSVEEVADAIVALADERLSLLTGNVLRVDGLESLLA